MNRARNTRLLQKRVRAGRARRVHTRKDVHTTTKRLRARYSHGLIKKRYKGKEGELDYDRAPLMIFLVCCFSRLIAWSSYLNEPMLGSWTSKSGATSCAKIVREFEKLSKICKVLTFAVILASPSALPRYLNSVRRRNYLQYLQPLQTCTYLNHLHFSAA